MKLQTDGLIRLMFIVFVIVGVFVCLASSSDAQKWAAPSQYVGRETVPTPEPEPVEAQDMEPRAWLPITYSNLTPDRWWLQSPQVVVQRGAPITLELYGQDKWIEGWDARLIWGADMFHLDSSYEVWTGWPVFDKTPVIHNQYGEWGQDWPWPIAPDGSHVLSLVLLPERKGFLEVTADVVADKIHDPVSKHHASLEYYSMNCVFDWSGPFGVPDGVRDIWDVVELSKHHGTGNPMFDVDGDGFVGYDDALIVSNYCFVPCPEVP